MRRAIGLALLIAAAARADDPQGTQAIDLQIGESRVVRLHFYFTSVTCDDPAVVKTEQTGLDLRFTGLRPGSTLCGLWTAYGDGMIPGGLYRVRVQPAGQKAR